MIVNMHEAKTHLSRLVERAQAGEEIVIGRSGRPVARLVSAAAKYPDAWVLTRSDAPPPD